MRFIFDLFKKKRPFPFAIGSVVVFNPDCFNKQFWDNLSEEDRIKYYGPLGYGQKKKKLFIYMGEILNAPDEFCNNKQFSSGHCVLVDMDTSKLEIMRHSSDFRLADESEF